MEMRMLLQFLQTLFLWEIAFDHLMVSSSSNVSPQYKIPDNSKAATSLSYSQLSSNRIPITGDLQHSSSLLEHAIDPLTADDSPRTGRQFGFYPLPSTTKKRRRTTPEHHLSLFAKLERKRPPYTQTFSTSESFYPRPGDSFISPSHNYDSRPSLNRINLLSSSAADSYRQSALYNEDEEGDEESPISPAVSSSFSMSSPSSSTYSKSSSSYKFPHAFASAESYNSPSGSGLHYDKAMANVKFPPLPPLPSFDDPSLFPRSETEARKQAFKPSTSSSSKGENRYNPFSYDEDPEPVNYDHSSAYDTPQDDVEDEVDADIDYQPPPPPPRQRPHHRHRNKLNPRKKNRDDVEVSTNPEFRRKQQSRLRKKGGGGEGGYSGGGYSGQPYGKPSPVSLPRTEFDDADEESLPPSIDETLGADFGGDDEVGDDYHPSLPPRDENPRHRTQYGSAQEPGARRRRCVKKKKSMETDFGGPEGDEEEYGEDSLSGRKMSCMVCENLETGGTYETCSYKSQPQKKRFYAEEEEGQEQRHSGKKRKLVHRAKRSIFSSGEHDDFETPEHFEDDEDFSSYYQPEMPSYANEDSCVEVKKKGISCMVCVNPETNGKYKQCSYGGGVKANKPEKSAHEYGESYKYGSSYPATRRRYRRQPLAISNSTAQGLQKLRAVEQDKIQSLNSLLDDMLAGRSKRASRGGRGEKFKFFKEDDEHPHDEDDSASFENKFLNVFPELGALNNRHDESSEFSERSSLLSDLTGRSSLLPSSKHGGDLFSGRSSGEIGFGGRSGYGSGGGVFKSKINFGNRRGDSGIGSLGDFKGKVQLGSMFKGRKSLLGDYGGGGGGEDGGSGDMSQMMREFAKKDRSACQKRMKDKMTCYVCDDEDGIKREECMYIKENEPKKVTYKESTKSAAADDQQPKGHKREVSTVNEQEQQQETMPIRPVSQRKYTRSIQKPEAYSNVEITFTQEKNAPPTTVFKRYAEYSQTVPQRNEGKEVSDGEKSKDILGIGNETNGANSAII